MQFGVHEQLFVAYHAELAVQRESQRNIRDDYADGMRSVACAKRDLERDLEYQKRLMQRSPTPGAYFDWWVVEAEIQRLQRDWKLLCRHTVAPPKHLPRGLIARISLRLLPEYQAHYNDTMCSRHDCMEHEQLTALKSEHTLSG